MGAETIGDVSEDLRPVFKLDPVHTVGQRLDHDPLHEWGALGHETRVYQTRNSPPGGFAADLPSKWGGEMTKLGVKLSRGRPS